MKLNWAHIGLLASVAQGWIWKFTSEKQFLTWINACILIWQSQWLLTNEISNQNVIVQTQIKPCKFWNETWRILENGQQIQKDLKTRIPGLALKQLLKVSPTRLGMPSMGGFCFCPFSSFPSQRWKWFNGVFAMNPSLNPLGCSKPMEIYSMCEPNQKKI
jgi:hypothetical protein